MAIAGIGCEFQKVVTVSTNPSSTDHTWENVAEIMSVEGPSPERDVYDITTIDSTGNYREFIPGLKDGGEVSLEMNYTPESYQQFKDEFDKENEAAVQWYSVVFNDNAVNDSKHCLFFQAMAINLGNSIPTDDKVSANVTLKVTGNPYFSTVGERDSSTTIVASGQNPLVWRGFLIDVTLDKSDTTSVILPAAFGGSGSISYAIKAPTGYETAQGIQFDSATRTLSITSAASASAASDIPLVYTATSGSVEIRQGILVTVQA